MRTRLSKTERRADILEKARHLFFERGLTKTEMEDLRLLCGISRGGLYHHFPNKRAVLNALVKEDVCQLVDILNQNEQLPILVLIEAGSSHLNATAGVSTALQTHDEKLDYLSALEQAFSEILRRPLCARLSGFVRDDINTEHVAELFLTISAHINRCEILGLWTSAQAAGFAATALAALAPLLNSPEDLTPIIQDLKQRASSL